MKRKIGKWMIIFLAVMVCCTVAARAASGVLTAKVVTDQIRKGSLKTVITGQGKVQAGEISCQFLPEGQKIAEVLVNSGSAVAEGQDILRLDEGYLQGLIDENTSELEKLHLQLKQQQMQGKAQARTPETASAQITLDGAKERLNQAQANYDEAAARAQQFAAAPPPAEASQEEIDQWNQELEGLNGEAENLYDQLESQAAEYNQAVRQYNLAQENEANQKANQERDRQANELVCKSIEVDIADAQKKIEKLETIREAGCVVKAQAAGIFLDGGGGAGTVTTGSELLRIAVGALQVMGQMEEKNIGKAAVGDQVNVRFPGRAEPLSLTITHFGNQAGNQEAGGNIAGDGGNNGGQGNGGDGFGAGGQAAGDVWYAQLEGQEIPLGTVVSYEITEESEVYQKTVPLSALREVQGSVSILSVEKRDSILGEEYVAVSVPVTVLGKDQDKAAIECTLDTNASVIVSAGKYVEEGDPVRLEK